MKTVFIRLLAAFFILCSNTLFSQQPHIVDIPGTTNSKYVFIGGQRFRVLHFNGVDWKRFTELEDNTYGVEIRGVQVFDNKVFLVGYNSNNVIIFRGETR